ncbi:hypothetical protein KAR26_04100 [Candidatus Parcubacteria bacterium]|nr:hypothetical protein [Candidatus Parcubacteria bacterium]
MHKKTYGRMTKAEYPQKNIVELINKLAKKKKMSRELKNLENGFYLLIYKKPEKDAIYKSSIIKIIAINKTAKTMEVIKFYGPDRVSQWKKEGSVHIWQGKKTAKEFSGFDLRYFGITAGPIPDDTTSCYHPIPLDANEIKQAIKEAKIIAEKLDMPLM